VILLSFCNFLLRFLRIFEFYFFLFPLYTFSIFSRCITRINIAIFFKYTFYRFFRFSSTLVIIVRLRSLCIPDPSGFFHFPLDFVQIESNTFTPLFIIRIFTITFINFFRFTCFPVFLLTI